MLTKRRNIAVYVRAHNSSTLCPFARKFRYRVFVRKRARATPFYNGVQSATRSATAVRARLAGRRGAPFGGEMTCCLLPVQVQTTVSRAAAAAADKARHATTVPAQANLATR